MYLYNIKIIFRVLLFLKIAILFFFNLSCTNNVNNYLNNQGITNIDYEKSFDFGEIQIGDSIIHDFTLKNIGKKPLIIENVNSSCGCTLVEWSHNPILPDNITNVKVMFKSDLNNQGQIKKSVVVRANTDPVFHVFYLTGQVKNN